MVSNRDNRSDGESREHSRPGRKQRFPGQHYDQQSVDSGYGGSAAPASPQASQRRITNDRLQEQAGMNQHGVANAGTDSGEDGDSDSDYDPKAKYYLTANDEDYQNISFRGAEASAPGASKATGKRRDSEDDATLRRRRGTHDRHRHSSHRRRSDSMLSSESDTSSSRRHDGRSQQQSSRRDSDSSRSKPRRDSAGRPLSPIASEPSEDWETSPERRHVSRTRRTPHGGRRRRGSSASSSDHGLTDPETEDALPRRSDKLRRPRTHDRAPGDSRNRALSGDGSSSYKGVADMDAAWYKTFKERLTKGVDMAQVKKVGLDAAAVAAVKIAVGTQMPWKQRIPKTIAVGLAAAVTDFIVSKTSIKPKGMVGTMYVRQFVEIALSNLIINPTSNKVQQKLGGGLANKGGKNKPAGGRARPGATATGNEGAGARGSGGRGRR